MFEINKKMGTVSSIIIWYVSLLWLIGNKLSEGVVYNANPALGVIAILVFIETTAWFGYNIFRWITTK